MPVQFRQAAAAAAAAVPVPRPVTAEVIIGGAVCDADPGFPVAVTVTASLRRMVEIWRGDLGWPDALRSGAIEVHGPQTTRRAIPGWFTLPAFASVQRPARHLTLPPPPAVPQAAR